MNLFAQPPVNATCSGYRNITLIGETGNRPSDFKLMLDYDLDRGRRVPVPETSQAI